jgi:hypothetical protein
MRKQRSQWQMQGTRHQVLTALLLLPVQAQAQAAAVAPAVAQDRVVLQQALKLCCLRRPQQLWNIYGKLAL